MIRFFIKRIKKMVSKFLNNSDYQSLLVSYIYLFLATISPTHKFFFIISFIYFILLVFLLSSIEKAIIYSFFPLLLFNVGQERIFNIVPAGVINSEFYWSGRNLTFQFSPFFILSITSFLLVFFIIFFKKAALHFNSFTLLFLIAFTLHFISAIHSTQLNLLSFLYTIEEFSLLLWMVLLASVLKRLSIKERNILLTTLFFIFLGLLILESGIVILQVIKRSALGLKVEKVNSIPSFGTGADENKFQFRPVGLSYHANSLANWHISLLTTLMILGFRLKNNFQKKFSHLILTSILLMSLVTILLTLSRSAYLSLTIFILTFLLFLWGKTVKFFKFIGNYLKDFKIFILFLSLYFSLIVPDRILRTIFTFTESGGVSTRSAQLVEALELIRVFPLFGVGIGMFIPSSYRFNPSGIMSYFPENIHNGYILFLAERGLVAAFFYLAGLLLLIRMVLLSKWEKTAKLLAVVSIISNHVMMLFQPFVNTLTINILVIGAMVGVMDYENKK